MNGIFPLDKVYFVSIFDHWLSECEADDCKVLSYSIALSHQKVSDYLIGEKNFISLYQSIDHKVIILYDNYQKEMSVFCDEFLNILEHGLRERKTYRFIFEQYQIMIESGYDRTDKMFTTKETNIDLIKKIVDDNHLFIIDCITYKEYIDESI